MSAASALRARVDAERDRGRAVVCVTHDPAELWDHATRLLVIVDGRLVHDAARPESLDEFRRAYARMIEA